jgi:ADP-ribose pyrophosphatase YjhB (NUDIX family)
MRNNTINNFLEQQSIENLLLKRPMEEDKKIGVGFGVMLLKDSGVLLGKRHEDPEKDSSELHGAGTWTMHGGKLNFGEKYQDAAFREVLEETGIEIDKENLKLIKVNNDGD